MVMADILHDWRDCRARLFVNGFDWRRSILQVWALRRLLRIRVIGHGVRLLIEPLLFML